MNPEQRIEAALIAAGRNIAEVLCATAELIAISLAKHHTVAEPPASMPKRLMNTAEAAEFLGVSVAMLQRDRSVGLRLIPCLKIGRAIRYDRNALEAKISAGDFLGAPKGKVRRSSRHVDPK